MERKWVEVVVREVIGCYNTTDESDGIKLKVTDHLG